MRAVPVVAVVVLLTVAGCGGLTGPSPDTPTPASAPTDATATTASAEAVPGVSNGSLTDAEALVSAHASALSATGFESDYRVNATGQSNGRVIENALRQRTIVEPNASEYVYRFTDRARGTRFDTWGNRSVAAVRASAGNSTRYRVARPTSPRVLTNGRTLQTFLGATPFEVESVERRGNLTLVTLVSTGTPDPNESPGVVPKNATGLRSYEARAVVDTRGRVLRFQASANYTVGGENGSMTVSYEVLRDDRPSVERPEWVPRVLQRAEWTPSPPG